MGKKSKDTKKNDSKKKTKIFISTPCYDAMMTMQYTMSLLRLMTFLNQKNIEFVIDFIGNESLITRARNKSLGKFMDSDFTHLLFIDSDIEFPEQAVIDLLQFDKDVVCCTYPKKSFNWNRFMYSMQNETKSRESLESRGLDYAYNAEYNDKNEVVKCDNFIKVKHASTGFMMIKMDILERLREKHKELEIISDDLSGKDSNICGLFCCMIKDKMYLSEDYSFCERVNEIGGEIWISTKHNLNHVGKNVFTSDIKNRNYYGRSQNERMFYN